MNKLRILASKVNVTTTLKVLGPIYILRLQLTNYGLTLYVLSPVVLGLAKSFKLCLGCLPTLKAGFLFEDMCMYMFRSLRLTDMAFWQNPSMWEHLTLEVRSLCRIR